MSVFAETDSENEQAAASPAPRSFHNTDGSKANASLADRGAAHYRLGQYEQAKALLKRASEEMTEQRGKLDPALLPVLNDLSRVYLQLGELKRAWKCSERALKTAEMIFGAQSVELARPLSALVDAYFGLGLLDKALRAAERAFAILSVERGNDHVETAKSADRLGVILAEMGACAPARELHLRALEIMRAHGEREWIARILANLATTYLIEGEAETARPLFEQALATAHTAFGDRDVRTGTYFALLGDHCASLGEDSRALELYQRAFDAKRNGVGEIHPDVAAILIKIGEIQYRSNAALGRKAVFQAIAIMACHQQRPRLFIEAFSFLATMLRPSSAAILFWKLAINEIEGMRAHVARLDASLERAFLRRNVEDFRALGDGLIGLGRLPEAQQVLVMIKERELFNLTRINAQRSRVSLTLLEALWTKRLQRLLDKTKASLESQGLEVRGDSLDQVTALRTEIEKAGEELAVWFDDIAVAFSADETVEEDYAATSVTPWQTPSPGAALLQYLLAPDHTSIAIILTTSGLQRDYRIAFADGEINRLVYTLREALQNRSPGFLESAQRLYGILIAPVVADLQANGIGTLIFSLDGVLRYLPVAALHDGQRYLVEQFALLFATSAVGAQQQNNDAGSRRAAGLGVSRPLPGYQPLSGVREELAAVIRTSANHHGILPGLIHLDEAFTADALYQSLSPRNSVIHLASHFIFETAHEASSYLLLGDGSRLTLAELGNLRFDAVDLVVLSACNTAVGGGRRQSGREVEGLGAVVRHQGARKVLATLWPVADLATPTLMRAFYRNRYESGLDPPEALRRAQMSLLADALDTLPRTETRGLVDPEEEIGDSEAYPGTSHPFYWAPYILMGEMNQSTPDSWKSA